MSNVLINAAIVAATLVGGGLVGMGINNLTDNAGTTVTINQPAITTKPLASETKTSAKKVRHLDLTDKNVLTLYGVVGDNAYYLAKAIADLGNSGKPIYLLINSPGGSVLDGALVVSAIEASPVPVYTICEQLCASMANIIHQYGHKRMMVDRAILMGHPASGGLEGTLEQMQSRLSMIQKYVNKFNIYIADRAGVSLETYQRMTVSEHWIDAEDATNAKFNDEIVSLRLPTSPGSELSILSNGGRNVVKKKVNLNW